MKLQRAPLGELCELVKGTSPISRTSPGAYPLVTTGKEHKTADNFQLDAEAVCIPLISSTGHGHASLKRVHYQSGKFALANLLAAALIKDKSVLLPKFLARYLNFTKDRLIVPLMTGAANMSISVDRLATVPIEFPPLVEQERSVELLDEADELQKLRAQADQRTATLIPALFHEMFGNPVTNPKHWDEGVLGDIIHAAQDGPHVSPRYSDRGVPFLSARHIRPGEVIWTDLKYLSQSDAEVQWKKCKPERGDVLYTKGGTTGVAAAIGFDTEIAVWVHIALLKTNHERVNPIWLESMLNSSFCYQQSQRLTHGIANRDLGLTRMIRIKLFIPPLEQQKEFAARVTEIRAVQVEQATSRLRLENLFQSLLHSAFNGDL